MKAAWPTLGIALILFLAQFPIPLRAQDHVEVFGGYSYFRASVTETGQILCPGPPSPNKTVSSHPNLNGWDADLEYKALKDIGFIADFGGNYGSLPNSAAGGIHTNTYLSGPRVSLLGANFPFCACARSGGASVHGQRFGRPLFLPSTFEQRLRHRVGGWN